MFKNSVLKPNVNTVEWIKAASVRAVKTMAQVASATLVIGTFNETEWTVMVETALVAGLASMLTSVAGIPEVKEE